jgi:hypothetical protein
MDTLLLIARWVGVIFLVICVFVAPSAYLQTRDPKDSPALVLTLLGYLCVVFAGAAYGLIIVSWTPLLLALRMGFAAVLIVIGILCAISLYRKRPDKVNLALAGFCVLFFVGIGLGLILLNWRWLLVSAACFLSGIAVLVLVRAGNMKRALKGLQQLAEQTRSIPMTLSEAKERLGLGQEIGILSLVEEGRLGRVMTTQELAAFAAEQRAAFEQIELDGKQISEEYAAPAKAEEQPQEALETEMKAGPAATRSIRINLNEAIQVTGTIGGILSLQAGEHLLRLQMSLQKPPDDEEGYPVVLVEISTETGDKVTRKLFLPDLIDLQNVERAWWWRARELPWQQSFAQHVLLEAVESVEDDKDWKEFPVDDGKIGFYSRSGSLRATLACPPPHDKIWCRIHALEHMAVDESGEPDDWKTESPFCFPLNIETLLSMEEHID